MTYLTVIDTHRLPYRNAQLRAFSRLNPTSRIPFYNGTSRHGLDELVYENIGDVVYTNEMGYLFYGSNKIPVINLLVKEDAVIQVSLDGGMSWSIEWILSGNDSGLTEKNVATLTYTNSEGESETYNPLGPDRVLPDYIRRDELDPDAFWAEETIVVEPTDSLVKLTEWTRTVIIPNINRAHLMIDYSDTRAGQSFTVISESTNVRRLVFVSDATADMAFPVQPSEISNKSYVFHIDYNSQQPHLVFSSDDVLSPIVDGDVITRGGIYVYAGTSNGFVSLNRYVNGIIINVGTALLGVSDASSARYDTTIPSGASRIIWNGHVHKVMSTSQAISLEPSEDNLLVDMTPLRADTLNIIKLDCRQLINTGVRYTLNGAPRGSYKLMVKISNAPGVESETYSNNSLYLSNGAVQIELLDELRNGTFCWEIFITDDDKWTKSAITFGET